MTHPSLLFITSHAFNNVTGTGITFSHLFKGWPKENLLTIHNDPVPVSEEVCNQYYKLGKEFCFFGIHKKKLKQNYPSETLPSFSASGKIPIIRYLKNVIRKRITGDSGLTWYFSPSESLRNILDAFQPDIVYTILGSVPIMQCVRWVCQEYRTKLIIHLMDDWPSASYKTGIFKRTNKRRNDELLKWCVENSHLRFSICDAMSSAFSARYGVPFKSYRNAVDVHSLQTYLKPKSMSSNKKKCITYVGSVYSFAQSESLLDVARVVERTNEKDEIQFNLFVPDLCFPFAHELLKGHLRTSIFRQIEKDQIYYQTLRESDILLLPSNFDPKSIEFIRYSMPTKIPPYLLSGTPILVYGSKETAQVQYAKEAGWGYCVTERIDQILEDSIQELLLNNELRNMLVSRAMKTVSTNHDLPVVSVSFHNDILKVFKGSS